MFRAGCHVLLINNDQAMAKFFKEKLMLNGGYSVISESSVSSGLDTFTHSSFDVVIAKLNLPDKEAEALVRELKRIDPDCIIIAYLNTVNPEILKQVSRLGVYEVISKPVNLDKLLFLIKKGVDLHLLAATHRKLAHSFKEQNATLQKQNILLAKRIEESTKNLARLYEDLRQTYMRTIKVLAQAIDARDHYTHSHSENVARYAVAIAAQMGLGANELEVIHEACELHDLGKIGVEDSILGKSSELTELEWEQVRKHPVIGAQILEPLTFLNGVIELIRQHHEHYDGSGYPEKRSGGNILLGARIIHVADAYEAMRSARSYRKTPLSKEDAIAEIKRNSGKQFDPEVVVALLKVVNTF
ncbi:MAG: HD domain-containing phosphohydrolase [Candidatus Omnitrophota bacterium]